MKRLLIFVILPILFSCSSEKNNIVKPKSSMNAALMPLQSIRTSAVKMAQPRFYAKAQKPDSFITAVIMSANNPILVQSLTGSIPTYALNAKNERSQISNEVVIAAIHSGSSFYENAPDTANKPLYASNRSQVIDRNADVVIYEHD